MSQTKSNADTVVAPTAEMPQQRNKGSEWHVAALFLFYLYEKEQLREKVQSKEVVRRIYYEEFKPEFFRTDPALLSKRRDFPSFFTIMTLYLDRRLLMRQIGLESRVLRFNIYNVETFLKIFKKKVLKKKPDSVGCRNGVINENNHEKLDNRVQSNKRKQKFVDQAFASRIIDKYGDKLNQTKPAEKYCCTNCGKSFQTELVMRSHFIEDGHLIKQKYQKHRKEMVAKLHSLQINMTNSVGLQDVVQQQEYLFPNARDESEKNFVFKIVGKDCVKGTINLTLINYSTSQIALTDIFKINKGFDIVGIENQNANDDFIVMPMPLPKQLSTGGSARLVVKFSITAVGSSDYFIFLKVQKENQSSYIMQKFCVSVVSEFTLVEEISSNSSQVMTNLQNLQEYSKPAGHSYEIESSKIVRFKEAAKKKKSSSGSKGLHLPDYKMPKGLINVLNHGFKLFKGITQEEDKLRRKIWSLFELGLNADNYEEYFSLLLFIEHHQMTVDILKYRVPNAPLLRTNVPSTVALDVPGLAEKRPSVLRGDRIMVTVSGDQSGVEYEGMVQKIENTRVLLKFSKGFMDIFIPNMKVSVRFDFSRHPHNLQHRALEMMIRKRLMEPIAFPSEHGRYTSSNLKAISWFNRLVQTNERQKEAVLNIVMGSSKPAPYLLFGPPGTGKTVTIVEAILQILTRDPAAHVLVAAPSNAAVDVVSSRLLNHWPPSQLLRFYSPCREWSQVPDILKKSCNCKDQNVGFVIPTLDEIRKPRIVAATMITCGRLVSMRVPVDHFSHLVIDECAQGLEPEALISIAGLLPNASDVSASKAKCPQVVLAGDPLQLGPVLRSPIAKRLGLEKSLLERLMSSGDMYQRDEHTNQYNPKVLTKLVVNFRSHPTILDLPNRLFYQGELVPAGDKGITYSACKWDLLPKRDVPIIFHGIEGKEERDHLSPSYFNTSEIHQVVHYLKEILASKFQGAKIPEKEIGIISPYRRQVEKIRASITKNKIGRDVCVASVEEFQGQERRVIIISTVRSDPQSIVLDHKFRLGFLREPKRFNVAVTRAKSLLVIIGNPHILQKDPCWGELLKHCLALGCYTGVRFELAQAEEGEDEGEEEEEENEHPEGAASSTTGSAPGWGPNALMEQFERLSLRTNDTSDVQKMIEPPWESNE